MKKITINVVYNGKDGINEELDKKLISAMESIGAKWYAQGTYLQEPFERDISFEMEVEL